MTVLCDFCSDPDVRWSYPTRDLIAHSLTPDKSATLLMASAGGWAACPACYTLIQSSDRAGLAKRSAKKLLRAMPVRPPLADVTRHVRDLHDSFWANREGQPVPTDPNSPDPTRR